MVAWPEGWLVGEFFGERSFLGEAKETGDGRGVGNATHFQAITLKDWIHPKLPQAGNKGRI